MSGEKQHVSKAMLLALLRFVSSCVDVSSADTCRTLTTYNTGLSPRVTDYNMRIVLQGNSLLNEDADVFCLQETWFESDMAYTLGKLMDVYKYHFSALHSSVNVLLGDGEELKVSQSLVV
ncbi:hypothetical protein ElyMa_005676900 [Elysia marginata]|uniref:Endonuclease/exonuclease/phosphatase domain-containing protein n=1 Tax=Elysia marginata TaxID=1093978 RepID=A0AAV4FE47_9GAST|nr:hypothetical protein ElyMa_005676900 [Elysia marginata]